MHGRYFSYGASVEPSFFSIFRHSHRIIAQEEGPNDGLVSVASSKWGGDSGYKGTLLGVNHLDLINWTNRLKFYMGELIGNKRKFVWAMFLITKRRETLTKRQVQCDCILS